MSAPASARCRSGECRGRRRRTWAVPEREALELAVPDRAVPERELAVPELAVPEREAPERAVPKQELAVPEREAPERAVPDPGGAGREAPERGERVAKGGRPPGRWVEVAPERFPGWAGSFADRHGELTAEPGPETLVLRAADGAVAECYAPFPPMPVPPGGDPAALAGSAAAHAAADRTVGVLLVRLGGYAAGVFTGTPPVLVASKTGARLVHGRSAAGGWSQQRFARRREKQAAGALGAAADAAVRVLGPYLGPASPGRDQRGRDQPGQRGGDEPGQRGRDQPGQRGGDEPGQRGRDQPGQRGGDEPGQRGGNEPGQRGGDERGGNRQGLDRAGPDRASRNRPAGTGGRLEAGRKQPGSDRPGGNQPGPQRTSRDAPAGTGGRLDAVVLGGDRRAIAGVSRDPRLAGVLELAVDRFLTVPDPRLAVLRDSPRLFRAIRVLLAGPF